MKATISIVWSVAASLLLFLLGIPTVVVSSLAINKAESVGVNQWQLYENDYRDDIYQDLFNSETGYLIYSVALGTSLGSTRSIVATGAIAMAVALASVFILVAGSRERNRPAWLQYGGASIGVAAATTISSIVGLAYSMAKTYSSSTVYQGPYPELPLDEFYSIALGGPGNGTYSLEAWTCQSRGLFAISMGRGTAEEMCRLSVCCSVFPQSIQGE